MILRCRSIESEVERCVSSACSDWLTAASVTLLPLPIALTGLQPTYLIALTGLQPTLLIALTPSLPQLVQFPG